MVDGRSTVCLAVVLRYVFTIAAARTVENVADHRSVCTVVIDLGAVNVGVKNFASISENDPSVNFVVDLKFVSIIDSETTSKSVEEPVFVDTAGSDHTVKTAAGLKFVSIGKSGQCVSSVVDGKHASIIDVVV